MKKTFLLLLLILPVITFAQSTSDDKNTDIPFVKRTTLEAGATISTNGDIHNVALNGMQYWGFGKKNRRFKLGAGLRLNNIFGNDGLEYITAPGDLTGDEANLDTILFDGTQVMALNLFVAFRYDITERWGLEANIDVAGFSFGGEKTGVLTYNDGQTFPVSGSNVELDATPTAGNLLLIGDNDIGNLNSEFMLTYRYKSNWRFKAGAVYMFNEYSLGTVVRYTNSAGTVLEIQRYRSKNMTFGVGVNYVF